MKIKTPKREMVSAGMHVGVLAELVDMGEDETPWGETGQLCATFEVEEKNRHDERMIITKYLNPTFGSGSNLRAMSEALLGRPLTPREVYDEELDTDDLVGLSCQINVIHATSQTSGKESDRIDDFMQLGKGQEPIEVSEDFVPYLERQIKWKEKQKDGFKAKAEAEEKETRAAAKDWQAASEKAKVEFEAKAAKGKVIKSDRAKGKKAGKSSDQPTLSANVDDEAAF